MSEYSDYQFYTPGQATPPPKPWWRERRTWVAFGVLVGFCGVAFLLGLLIINLLKNRPASDEQNVDALVSQLSAHCAEADVTCRDQALSDAARTTGSALTCKQISVESSQINCAALIAKDKNDLAACEVLLGSAKDVCQDQANLFLASSASSFTACEAIVDPALKAGCAGAVWARVVATNNCTAVGAAGEACDSARLLKAAEDSGNRAACAALQEADRDECVHAIETADEDLDGLVAEQEFVNGTDPQNPDTDGDGFMDGIEVQNGYDPLVKQ